MKEKLLTVTDAAEMLSVSTAFIKKLIYSKRISSVRVGRCLRLKESEINAIAQIGLTSSHKKQA